MTYDLAIGDRAYSSWSLRGWLLFDAFGIPVRTRSARLYSDELPTLLREFHPARTAPALRLPDGTVVMESLAIAEELASRHPEAGLWPEDPRARAVARSLAAEMHAGFQFLRSQCPMNLRVSYAEWPITRASAPTSTGWRRSGPGRARRFRTGPG
jgi:glutathione S-transferase